MWYIQCNEMQIKRWPRRCGNTPRPGPRKKGADRGRDQSSVRVRRVPATRLGRIRPLRRVGVSTSQALHQVRGTSREHQRTHRRSAGAQSRGRRALSRQLPARLPHSDSRDGRDGGDAMSSPTYEERECWRCHQGRVYQLSSALKGAQSGRWVPCPSCDGTQRVRVFVYAKKPGSTR